MGLGCPHGQKSRNHGKCFSASAGVWASACSVKGRKKERKKENGHLNEHVL